MALVDRWLVRWSANYAFLRRAVDEVGRDLARRPYAALLRPDQELSFSQFVDGIHLDFEVDVFRIDGDGTLWVCVDVRGKLPTPLGIRPSCVFRKHPDGRAFVMLD
jgi:sugar lactone lactonase YvrE